MSQELHNFLHPKLMPKVTTESPATDNFEVDNLISEDYRLKMRGFIAYPSIKPPVEVEFNFICPVNIHYISINTTVGSQKCTGIDVLGKTDTMGYSSICRRVFEEPGIIFCNSKFYSKTKVPETFNSNFHLAYFKSSTFRIFLNTSSIKIVIFRTEKSVPCLSSVEVWGIPSKTCSQVTVQTINRLMKRDVDVLPNSSVEEKDQEFKIPDDFKDDLTYEIMTIPMTLPSGKTVDQSTLEKHVSSEITLGRKPCDPFTGIKFNDNLKPILNVALKSRIDMFLMLNSYRKEFFHLKRTLGRGSSGICEKRKLDSEDSGIMNTKCFRISSDKNNVCVGCENKFTYLYNFPCEHFHCRTCLLKARSETKCLKCTDTFRNSEVYKIHF